jgi:nucleotide-binding universal stress UspA family protein
MAAAVANFDLFRLAAAPLSELAHAARSALLSEQKGQRLNIPQPSSQIAELALAETVRLIRLGAGSELADQAAEVARMTSGRRGAELEELDADVYRRFRASATVLRAAAAPSSRGGELTVLRGWNGRARQVAALVQAADDQIVSRSEIRRRFGFSQSHTSHMLADLEDAALIVRSRRGRTVLVHAGPKLDLPYVREILATVDLSDLGEQPAEPDVPPVIVTTPRRTLRLAPRPSDGDTFATVSVRPAALFAPALAA